MLRLLRIFLDYLGFFELLSLFLFTYELLRLLTVVLSLSTNLDYLVYIDYFGLLFYLVHLFVLLITYFTYQTYRKGINSRLNLLPLAIAARQPNNSFLQLIVL